MATTHVETRDSDGLYQRSQGNPNCPLLPRTGYTIREVPLPLPTGLGVLKWDATSSEMMRYVAPLTLEQAKAARLTALNEAYGADLALGVAVTAGSPPITATLAADLGAQGRLAALLSLWSNAENHAWDDAYADTTGDAATKTAAAQAATVTFNAQSAGGVVDAAGILIPATIDQMRRLIVALGQVCAGKQFALQASSASVNAATTVAEVDAVS